MSRNDDYVFELIRRFGLLLRPGRPEGASHNDGDQRSEAATGAGFSRQADAYDSIENSVHSSEVEFEARDGPHLVTLFL